MSSREVEFALSTQHWEPSPVINLVDSDGVMFTSLPIAFMEQSNCESLMQVGFLYEVLTMVLSNTDGVQLQCDGLDCQVGDLVKPQIYQMARPLAQDIQFAKGPQGKSRFKTLRPNDSASTVSRSSRSSFRQTTFRYEVGFRDAKCLVTDSRAAHSVMGCHIVPMSLGQSFLNSLTGTGSSRIGLYSVQNGLSLRRDVHWLYDQYKVGIWSENGRYYIHVFDEMPLQYHGKEITWGQPTPATMKPSPALLRWHYKQCVIARFRGFSIPMYTSSTGPPFE